MNNRKNGAYNKVYTGDCIKVINSKIGKNSIDLIFADPPYNLSGNKMSWNGNTTGGDWYMMNEDWDKMPPDEYFKFTMQWIKACKNILKDNSSIYIACSYHNICEVMLTLKQFNFKINNVITWYKTNAMPNMTKRTFTHSTEFIIWAVKGKGWVFNYDLIKEVNPNRKKDGGPKQMRDLWEIPLVQGRERLKGESGRALHPTQKPEEMLKRIILASSKKNSIVLDPFLGSGTTAIVAQKYGRNWIGIEKNKKYVNIALERLEAAKNC